ncbi:MAG: hypothetical protein H6815_02695 [Phycisphaeraceae bacterium]|nr:hypothetical protein [Phycisphaerales bacterium]MCB9859335.1 hypothetical protein [Phycisphaeraceae bacterium]
MQRADLSSTTRTSAKPKATALVRTTGYALTGDIAPTDSFSSHTPGCYTGVVEAADTSGPSMRDLLHTRVVVPASVPCATCSTCTAGLSDHCPHRESVYEPDAVSYVPVQSVVRIPNDMSDTDASFAQLAGTAMRITTEVPVQRDAFVSIVGSCARTLVCAQAMRLSCPLTRVVTLNQTSSALVAQVCDQLSIKHRPGTDAGRRSDQHAVVECSGSREGFLCACQLAQPRTTVVLAATRQAELFDLSLAHEKELRIVATRHGSLAQGVIELSRKTIDLAPVIRSTVSIQQIAGAWDDIRSGSCLAAYMSL